MNIDKAIEIAKPFVGSLRKKSDSRPILKTALVTEKHVITTDGSILIRILHNEKDTEPFIKHYKESTISIGYGPKNYPQTDRLFPDTSYAKQSFSLDVNEWIKAHTLAKSHAKELKNNDVILSKNEISVYSNDPNVTEKTFKHALDSDTSIEKVSYNCEYMLMALKAFKKMKQTKVTVYFYSSMRPMLFKADNIEVLLMPVRLY